MMILKLNCQKVMKFTLNGLNTQRFFKVDSNLKELEILTSQILISLMSNMLTRTANAGSAQKTGDFFIKGLEFLLLLGSTARSLSVAAVHQMRNYRHYQADFKAPIINFILRTVMFDG